MLKESKQVETFAEDLAFFAANHSKGASPVEVLTFPEFQADHRDKRKAFYTANCRLAVLSQLRRRRGPGRTGDSVVAVATPAALMQAVPPLEEFSQYEITLTRGQNQSFQALVDQLRAFDYDNEAVCEALGQCSVRGGIIDIYPATATHPYRLDFFGDTLEEIRVFDPVTQRSGDSLEKIILTAAPQLQGQTTLASLFDYLGPCSHAALVEPKALEEVFDTLGAEDTQTSFDVLPHTCSRLFGLSDLDFSSHLFDGAEEDETWDTEPLARHRCTAGSSLIAEGRLQAKESAQRIFFKQLFDWQQEGFAVDIIVSKEGEDQRTRELLEEDKTLKKFRPHFLRGTVNEGFKITFCHALADPAKGYVAITETEIFGRKRLRRSVGKRAVTPSTNDQLLDFCELAEGDFVVHFQHGIAAYRGLAKIETHDGVREVISLEFDDHVTLHVPLQESHLISRYVGLSKARPQLGKIGSGRWEKVRTAAERATVDLAAELLAIQARREAQPGHAFTADSTWQKEFETTFPFTETPDQIKAIAETKADMEKTRPMDRLVCGDVGFGKTEVAIRATFKAVMGGKQVAVLVPTTVLAQQHLNTFRERIAGYPVVVEIVSRFRSRKEQQRILAAVTAGKVDVLIGTHRLVQDDVSFKNLGLVVIDEEQRFGVKHKEIFKRWHAHVDILSMSATPIPRTLYLALAGARDLSTIETAPANRLPIQTIVKSYDEKLVVEAIQHEVRRGGQVFYLHNRVMSIDLVASRLRELLPNLSIGVGHGKMKKSELEHVMTDFVAGRYHVLMCTTIIESGLDIQNCNTIIIEGANRFGLSQLYQLRGRVGRFEHQAHAYLLLHRHARVLDLARQRLTAIRQHSQLGTGFRIAMRDLELRGAGNLLGAKQSGHIVGVGFELYCQLLRQSVARLKGEKHAAATRAKVKLDFVFVGESTKVSPRVEAINSYSAIKLAERTESEIEKIQACLPIDYIAETRLRIDFYRRLALAKTPAQVKQLGAELRDRFGKYNEKVRALLAITEIRVRAEQKGVLSVESYGNRLKCLCNSGSSGDCSQLSCRFIPLTTSPPFARLREVISFFQDFSTT